MSLPQSEVPPDEAVLALRVGQAAAGADHEAEAELCRRLAPRVRLYGLRHLRDEAAAADLVQQVMLTMIERLRAGALREPERLTSFVFGICRMVVLDLRRGDARRARQLTTFGEALVPADRPEPDLDDRRLKHCLERLSERERSVLLLTFYSEMPAQALALELALSAANVRVIRHRGLEKMYRCITGEWT